MNPLWVKGLSQIQNVGLKVLSHDTGRGLICFDLYHYDNEANIMDELEEFEYHKTSPYFDSAILLEIFMWWMQRETYRDAIWFSLSPKKVGAKWPLLVGCALRNFPQSQIILFNNSWSITLYFTNIIQFYRMIFLNYVPFLRRNYTMLNLV